MFSMSSMTDIIFLLLIFFMITSTMVTPNAIKVLTGDGHHVGYVPKDITNEVRKETTLPSHCYCYIGVNDTTYFSCCYILRKK